MLGEGDLVCLAACTIILTESIVLRTSGRYNKGAFSGSITRQQCRCPTTVGTSSRTSMAHKIMIFGNGTALRILFQDSGFAYTCS